ncbi:hypothetical protein [Desulfoluna spongiiphila]|uniref:Mechanosensitive ion channel n=1 Tax=Desulfoluna spongiiphila TaxID=419481 RepID=A0A1G5JP51_9BACT|nr:hypothetical protein [Desulfoluna spongiiphila]SCY90126.1 hypothetical protein SAMN05216233_13716 [Desulfoluna spongiiphila]
MASAIRRPIVSVLSLLLAGMCLLLAAPLKAEVPAPAAMENADRKVDQLSRLLVTIEQVKREVAEAQSALASPEALGKEDRYRARITRLTARLTALEEGFEQLATGVEKSATPPGGAVSSFEWNTELKELLAPLIMEIKDMTSRPREIQGLRSTLEGYDEELSRISKAMENIAVLQASPGLSPALALQLDTLSSKWQHREQELTSLKGLAELKLEEKEANKRTLSGSFQDVTRLFFKSRGRNLLMALVVLFGTLFAMGKLRSVIETRSRLYGKAQTVYARIFDLSYMLVTITTALLLTMGSLYLVSDWVLLSILLILVFGLVWTSKEAIPKVWGQVRMLLNLGAVREGERLLYQGVPYKVTSINLYSELENQALQGGLLRLPLKDLFDLRSRPWHPDEPWFPTQIGDWVLLADTTHAEVTVQSPDVVDLRLLGGATRRIPPAEFLALSPTNLSHGFRLEARFRLDPCHRNEAATTIPSALEKSLTDRFTKTHWAPEALTVQYRRTLPSFLEISVLADFPGPCAKDHPLIAMALEQHCLETAAEMAWDLPTHRMAVQMVQEGKSLPPAARG